MNNETGRVGIDTLQQCLRAARVVSRCLGGHLARVGLTPAQLEVLDVVQRQEGLPLSALSGALCCVESNVTALVDRMERDGLVERRRDARDRRVVRLFLGPAARERLARLAECAATSGLPARVLTLEEEELLGALLRKLVEGLRGACGEEGRGARGRGGAQEERDG